MKRSSSSNGRGGSSSRGKQSNTRSSSGRSSTSSSRSSSGRSASSSRSSTRSSDTGSRSSSGRTTSSSRSSGSRSNTRGNSSNGRSARSKTAPSRVSSRSKQQVPSSFTDDLQKVMIDGLKDIFYAEKQLAKGLNRMAKAAENEKLVQAFENHMQETEEQMERLIQVFDILGVRAAGKNCPAMDGLLEEAKEAIAEFERGPARDAALIMAAQKAEHYEIATYGSLRTFAETLGFDEVAQIFDDILDQESTTDELLTSIAQRTNQEAALASEGEEVQDLEWQRSNAL